jgi:hypothetical protein
VLSIVLLFTGKLLILFSTTVISFERISFYLKTRLLCSNATIPFLKKISVDWYLPVLIFFDVFDRKN